MLKTCMTMGRVGVFVGLAALAALPSVGMAGQLTVTVDGIETGDGEIGCALYAGPDGFPMDPAVAVQQWHAARVGGVDCRFDGLESGDYAVAVSQDFNGNRKTDTNFFGIPTEPWGVSNNVRPTLRAPTFEEARVRITSGADSTIAVRIAE